jgi:hypothetical protein
MGYPRIVKLTRRRDSVNEAGSAVYSRGLPDEQTSEAPNARSESALSPARRGRAAVAAMAPTSQLGPPVDQLGCGGTQLGRMGPNDLGRDPPGHGRKKDGSLRNCEMRRGILNSIAPSGPVDPAWHWASYMKAIMEQTNSDVCWGASLDVAHAI